MNSGDPVAGVAVDTEGGGGHRGGMAMGMTVEVCRMAVGATAASDNGGGFRPVDRVLQCRWSGVAV